MELKKSEKGVEVAEPKGAELMHKKDNMDSYAIHEDLQKMLIDQMAHELYNHNLYMSISNFYSVKGLKKLSLYYQRRAEEEYNHYMWCVSFANEADMGYIMPSIDAISEKWGDDLIKPFNITLDAEIDTTDMIYDMVDKAKDLEDYIFLQWLNKPGLLLEEQLEEMSLSRKALAIMSLDDSILAKQDAIASLYGI
jgi:ferritin